ncbi:MAG TPA: hypothetical protein DCQ50_21075 [Chryseobacterium sp.]|nr:hypothetical protein [Chryseobacterium sp.]
MPPRKKKELPDTRLRIENFYKRWNVDLSDMERWTNFKSRILNSYSSKLGIEILQNSKCEDEFFKLLGVHTKREKGISEIDISFNRKLIESPAYMYFLEEGDMKKFILALQVVFGMETIEWDIKYDFLEDIKDAIVITVVPIVVTETDDDVLFYPAGAKLLDEKLVNDNLDWLINYPKSYETFKTSLAELGIKGRERHVIDNLRLSFELLLKELFKNTKSLENQKAEVGQYLKAKKVSPEISNLYWLVSDYYCKYQNNNGKHSNQSPPDEVEFILYLTGTLIRFLLTK